MRVNRDAFAFCVAALGRAPLTRPARPLLFISAINSQPSIFSRLSINHQLSTLNFLMSPVLLHIPQSEIRTPQFTSPLPPSN
jgi:hypothetical protein